MATHLTPASAIRAAPSASMDVRLNHVTLLARSVVHAPRDGQAAAPHLPTIGHELRSLVAPLFRRAKTQSVDRAILRDVSGVFAPGTMTLVLGQPGSGKSSLLKLLGGRLRLGSKALCCEGDISYNGVAQRELLPTLPQLVSYVPQRDRHFPTLSVRETIAFAHACGARTVINDERKSHVEGELPHPTPDVILRQLGLEHCQDTVVGDAMLRGVSGGERKRVTLGEMDVGGRLVACLDEISTGLDSAATLDIVTQQRALATTQHKTVVMALLQPSPEVVELFDTIVLLNDGYVLYHGPRARIAEYFASMGLHCPPQRDLADFLMDIGTSQQAQYTQEASTPCTPSELAARFQQSEIHHANVRQVEAPMDVALAHTATQLHAVPKFYRSFSQNVALLVKRDFTVMLRNRVALQARLVTLVISSLLHGTLFYQLDPANAQLTMGILFATVLFLALEQSSQIPVFQAARAVFYKQRDANLFRTSAYVVATSIGQMPMAIAQALVFGTLVYWLCGFVPAAGEFVTFEVLLLFTNLAFNAWFFLLAVATPNLHVAEPFNLLSLLMFILFAGFMIARDLIPDYFLWAYWASPITWGLRSIVINQYRSEEFSHCEYKGIDYCAKYGAKSMGEYALSLYQVQTERFWLWLGLGFVVMSYVLFMALSAIVLEKVRFDEDNHDHVTPADKPVDAVASILPDTSSSSGGDAVSADYQLAKTPRHSAVTVAGTYERHFTPVTLAFHELKYSVPDPKNPKESLMLLKGISGYAVPGTITALMGSSGAGKTTLMDVIAGRKTGGEIQGKICLNGYEATDVAIRRCTAYCEQMDVHADASTIREALTFSAFLRQSSHVPASHKYESVEECLDLLDLRPVADRIIRGGSVELMKRLTIGVELAAQPSVLFLDEPTSGLDARAAKLIMDGVRNVANSGRTVVCTIHQPSFEVFQVFDNLLLLKRGGETVYFGEIGHRGRTLVDYFSSIEGVAPIPSDEYNPATWMLEVIGAGVGDKSEAGAAPTVKKDFVGLFRSSEKKARLDAVLEQDGMLRPAPGVAALSFDNKRAATESVQARALLERFFRTYWRTPDYMFIRFIVYVVIAILFGLAFFDRDFDTYQGINAGVAMVYQSTLFIGVIAFEASMPMASELRESFYRERASQTYNALWYFVGSSVVEIPYVFFTCLTFCGIFYPMVGFRDGWTFILYWVHSSLHVLLQTYIGELITIVLPDLGAAMTAGVVVSTVCFNTMGFNPPANALPAGYKWLYEIVPTQFAFSIIGSVLFGKCDEPGGVGCTELKGDLPMGLPPGTTVKAYVDKVFYIDRDEIWSNFGVIMAYMVLFRVLTLAAMRFVNHQHK